MWQKRPKTTNFLWHFLVIFQIFACGAARFAGGCRPPHPPRLILTCWRAAGRARRRSGKASAPARRRGGFRVLCNPASLILLPCHPPPIPTPPPPVRPTRSPRLDHSSAVDGGGPAPGQGRAHHRCLRRFQVSTAPRPLFLPPAPATATQADGSPCCSQVMAVRGGRCAPAGEERRGGDRVDEALCDAERGLGPFLPTGVAFSGAKSAQNAQNFPRPGALPPDPRQHTVLLPMRVARGRGETWAYS